MSDFADATYPPRPSDITERIAAGESPTAIMLEMLPPAERESLAHCALVRVFTEDLFERYLRCGGVDLADLIEHGWVHPLAGRGSRLRRYQIAPHLREDASNLWYQDVPPGAVGPPEELRRLSARLAAYFADINWPVEQLRQLAIADSTEAEDLFNRIYLDADRDFDLAYCQDLVDALSEPGRTRFMEKRLTDHVDERARRIVARGMRSAEYYQTSEAGYQSRQAAEQHFLRLLAPSPRGNRLLLLHGRGGTGKTTLLHWFIARQCVLRDPLVACARIDVDALDPVAVLEHPWLLLVEAVEQLDRQLPERTFSSLKSFGEYRGMLRRVPTGLDVAEGDGRRIELVGHGVELGFSSALVQGPPVLLALDGLDEITARSRAAPEPLRGLIDMLLRVQDKVGNLRVVLAGRDDLSELVPELMVTAEPIGVSSIGMQHFDEKEAAAYLKKRGVRDRPRVQAIYRMSEGLPMVVALYADLVEKKPELTAKQIRENTEPLIGYLIPRILAQITHPVIQGALLYSVVVPSDLTFTFFRDVMLPLWRDLVQGAGIPNDLDPERSWAPYEIPGPDDDQGQRRLWADIVDQAVKSKWISAREADGEQAVAAHSDVRVPLRVKVREFGTFAALHDRAADYYQRLADASLNGYQLGDNWRRWTKEVIYHRFQRQDPGATDFWRAALAQARRSRRIEWARDIADYLQHADFQNARGYPDFTVLSRQALYEAHIELALAAAQKAGRLPCYSAEAGSAVWIGEATTALKTARDVRIEADDAQSPVQPSDYETIVSALISVETESLDAAFAELDLLVTTETTALGDASLVRARGHAGCFAIGGFSDPPEAALDAYRAACDHHTEPEYVAYVALDAAQWLLGLDRPDLALKWSDRAEASWPSAVHPGGAGLEVRAQALLALGRPGSALAVLAGRPLSGRARRLAAEARLALRSPVTAVDDLVLHDSSAASDDSVGAGIEHELMLAAVYGKLFDIDRAEGCFERAQRAVSASTDNDFQARIITAQALFELRVTGNILRASTFLASDVDPTAVPPGQPTWTAFQLARAELADRQRRPTDVRQILADVREKLIDAQRPASSRIQVSLAGLTVHSLQSPDRHDHLNALVEDLAAIVPAARLALVADLLRARPVTADRDLAERLCALVAAGDPSEPAEADDVQASDYDRQLDQAWRDLVMAQLFRVTGRHIDYARRRAAALLTLRDDPFVRWDLLAAYGESADGHTVLSDPDAIPADPYQFHDRYGHRYAVLFAAFVTEWARQYDAKATAEEAYLWLQEAKRKLDARKGQRRTAWQARLYEALAVRADRRGSHTARELRDQAAQIGADLDDYPYRSARAERARLAAPSDTGPSGVTEILLSEGRQGRDLHFGDRRRAGDQPDPGKPLRVRSDFAVTDLGFDTLALSWGRRAGELLRAGMGPLLAADRSDVVDVRAQFFRPGFAADPWELVAVEDRPLATHPSLRFISRGGGDALSRRQQERYLRRAVQGLESTAGRPHRVPADATIGAWLAGFHREHNLSPDPGQARPETWRAIRAALREQAASASARPLRVRVIVPVVGGNMPAVKKLGERVDELDRTYRAAFARSGARWLDLRVTYADELATLYARNASPEEAADVLHVCTMMYATEQLPVLGLEDGSGPPLTAPELASLIQRLTQAVPPLVVLDVHAPPSPVETRRQLLMRNRFAHQLLTLGNVNTIIASGLAGQAALAQWQFIAEGLAEGLNAAEICRVIQRHQPAWTLDAGNAEDQDIRAVAFTATALFTSISVDSLIEPGLIG